ncbi:MAG: prepilin peptidase [Myxococcales bacterium]|nr:prepilin peptidase [Myxococcales bacterium]
MSIGPNHFLVVAVVVAGLGAFYDYRTGRDPETGEGKEGEIPNWLTLGSLALAPFAHFALGLKLGGARAGFEAAGVSVVGAFLCALVPFLLWRVGAGGGGDLKLFAAIGAICRPMVGIEAQFYAFLAAALIAPARLAWEGKLFKVLGNSMWLAINPFLPKAKRRAIEPAALTWFRLGPAIAAGTAVAAFLHWELKR